MLERGFNRAVDALATGTTRTYQGVLGFASGAAPLILAPSRGRNSSRIRRRGDASGPRRRGDYVSNTWDARATPWRGEGVSRWAREPKVATEPWPTDDGAVAGGPVGGGGKTHFNSQVRIIRDI